MTYAARSGFTQVFTTAILPGVLLTLYDPVVVAGFRFKVGDNATRGAEQLEAASESTGVVGKLKSLGAVPVAATAGFLWGFGPVGKRAGLDGAHPDNKAALAGVTAFAYNLGTFGFPVYDYMNTDENQKKEVLADSEWLARLPKVMFCACLSSVGTMFAAYALGVSAGGGSAVISVVENGLYAVFASLMILVVWHENPGWRQWFGSGCILLGIILTALTKTKKKPETAQSNESTSTEPRQDVENGQSSHSPSTQPADSMAGYALVFAALAGFFWGFGPVGKRLGAGGGAPELARTRATCTYFFYNAATILPTTIALFAACFKGRSSTAPAISWSKWCTTNLPIVLGCGLISGAGGVLGTLAFAVETKVSDAMLSMIENGVYTVMGCALIAIVFGESFNCYQLVSIFLVVFGLLAPSMLK